MFKTVLSKTVLLSYKLRILSDCFVTLDHKSGFKSQGATQYICNDGVDSAVPDISDSKSKDSGLEVGSLVEVNMGAVPKYGVIRWIGIIPELNTSKQMAGVEMVGKLYIKPLQVLKVTFSKYI